jgi:ATP-dependent Clp protease ATP-binding subunit ClpB
MKYLITGGDYLAAHEGFNLVGRDEDLKRLSAVLMRSKAASVLLVGPGGVGSTALCMGIQASKDDPNAPFDIISKRIHWLQTDELYSSENPNEAFQRVLEILKRTPDSVLIIEDARDFLEGSRNAGCPLHINSLNSLVKNGDTQVIIEVRDDDFEMVLKAHSDMRQCYTMIDLNEPIGENLVAIAKASVKSLSKHHSIEIDEDAVMTAIELTNKYRTKDMSLSRAQPERTQNLIDRAYSSYRLAAHANISIDDQAQLKKLYGEIRDGEIAIIDLEETLAEEVKKSDKAREAGAKPEDAEVKNRISSFQRMTAGAGGGSEEVRRIKGLISQIEAANKDVRNRFEVLTKKINEGLSLTKDDVLAEFSRLSGIPANKLNEDERAKLLNLAGQIKERIFGQDEVVDRVADAVKVARVGRRNGKKPQASYMFLGPSGTGKTELAKSLAQNLLDDESALTRFDMSEFMEAHSVATLIGAPPGYEGHEAGGMLTNLMRKNPHRIVLFDEIEKAHPDVFNIFLAILDDGRLTDRRGITVSFSESIVIMTSNIGQEELLDMSMEKLERQEAALAALTSRPGIRPEFLNRFAGRQNILFFNSLELETIAKIVRKEVNSIDAAYRSAGIETRMSDEEIMKFAKATYDPKTGARGPVGLIQVGIEPLITNTILEIPDFKGVFNITYDDGSFSADMVENG